MGEFIIIISLLTMVYFVLNHLIFKRSFKLMMIYSICFIIFVVILKIDDVISKNDNKIYSISTIIYSVILVATSLLIRHSKKDKDCLKKTKSKRYKTIKLYRLMLLILLAIDGFCVTLMFLIDSGFDRWKITNLIILFLILTWNIGFNLYFIKHKVKGEAFIVVTKNAYKIVDIKKRFMYRLNDYLNQDDLKIDKMIIGLYKDYHAINKYIRIFYINNYLLKDQDYNKQIHQILLNWPTQTIVLSINKNQKIEK